MENNLSAGSISEAIGTILAKLCYQASDELGASLADRTSEWRKRNALSILKKANDKYEERGLSNNEQAHPRLVHQILDEGSWSDDEVIQGMWSGLLASSCSVDARDESNWIFIGILKQLTSAQAAILNQACLTAKKEIAKGGWIACSENLQISLGDLIALTGVDDIHRLDRELDHLRALELIHYGFHPDSTDADITPSSLALHMYVRCQGSFESPVGYFQL